MLKTKSVNGSVSGVQSFVSVHRREPLADASIAGLTDEMVHQLAPVLELIESLLARIEALEKRVKTVPRKPSGSGTQRAKPMRGRKRH